MSLFTISLVVAAVVLLIGVVAIVRGRPFTGFLAVLLAIAVAAFGYWDTTTATAPPLDRTTHENSIQSSSSEAAIPLGNISRASTEA